MMSLALRNLQQPGGGMPGALTGAEEGPGMTAPPADPYASAPPPPAAKPAAFGPFPGLLNAPAGAPYSQPNGPIDLPPSTNDPQAQEPEVFKDGVPLPRPRPLLRPLLG